MNQPNGTNAGPLLAKERTTQGRIRELDYAKALCIIGLVAVHTMMYACPDPEQFYTGFGNVLITYLGGPIGAPLFMFCMGMGVVLSRHTKAKNHFIRGIGLLTFGLLLNIARYGLEGAIGPIVLEDSTYISLLILVFSVDIMQFAGLAFLLLGLLEKLKVNSKIALLIGVVLNIAGTLMIGVETGIYPIDQLFGFFWGTHTESYFPLFNWFIFVAAGKLYGEYYIRVRDYKRWYKIILPIGAVFTAVFYAIGLNQLIPSVSYVLTDSETGLTFINLFDACGSLAASITFIGLLWLAFGRIDIKPLTFISKNINKYYCLSYVYIILLAGITRLEILPVNNVPEALIASIIILFLVTGTILLVRRRPFSTFGNFLMSHKLAFFATIWVIGIVLVVAGFMECYAIDQFPNMFNNYLDL